MPNITVVFNPPNKADGRAKFEADCMDMGDKLNPFISQANALAAGVNADRLAAAASVADANTAKNDAIAARDAAIAASTMVASDYNPGGVSYVVNDLVWDGPGTLFRCILGYTSNATRPKDDPTHWARVNLTPADLTAITSAVAANTSAIDALRGLTTKNIATNYTLAADDRGKLLLGHQAVTVTIPPDSPTLPVGSVVMFSHLVGGVLTIAPSAGITLALSGTSKTGSLSVATNGQCSIVHSWDNRWVASGAGVS